MSDMQRAIQEMQRAAAVCRIQNQWEILTVLVRDFNAQHKHAKHGCWWALDYETGEVESRSKHD